VKLRPFFRQQSFFYGIPPKHEQKLYKYGFFETTTGAINVEIQPVATPEKMQKPRKIGEL